MMIRKCIKYYKKEEQSIFIVFFNYSNKYLIYFLVEQSNRLLRSETILQRNSSIRNSLTPYRRSSLDIRFLMECRERRLSQSQLILIPTQII